MNKLEEIILELQDENLIDTQENPAFNKDRNNNISKIYETSSYSSEAGEVSPLTKTISESLAKQHELRYSISGIMTTQTVFLPESKPRSVKRKIKFSRPCKCCDANVFWLDAYCPNCNERMIGNFFYYSFLLLCAGMIGFMVFYMATSNPY